MQTIGLFPNIRKPNIQKIVEMIVTYLNDRHIEVLLPEECARSLAYPELACSDSEIANKIFLGITLGGDGTILSTTRRYVTSNIPLLGVNMGKLGFLTEVELSHLTEGLDKIIKGDYTIAERLMLDSQIRTGGVDKHISCALNDVVITKGGFSRMIRLELYINDVFTANYLADGLIIATSTGSTGYSLSAGGSIVNPDIDVILVTPICPHTLNARPLIISANEEIRVKVLSTQDDIALTIDGQAVHSLSSKDNIIVRKFSHRAKFIKLGDNSFYETVRKKLLREDEYAEI